MHKICEHIKNKNVITITYKGSIRTIEPHLLGYDTKNVLTLSAWQLHGGSGQGFRGYHVSNISGVTTTGKNFGNAREHYNKHDKGMIRVVCCL